jgi:enamine deaminase RidA (YjgF/YER057c/UK114 family)
MAAGSDREPARPAFLRPAGLFPGAPYAYAAVAPGGAVWAAGACPLDEEGRVVGRGDRAQQARVAVANLLRALAAAGAGPADILKTTVYVVAGERADLVRVWDAYAAALAPHAPPSTLLGVSFLGYTDQLVEVEAVAIVPAAAQAERRPVGL